MPANHPFTARFEQHTSSGTGLLIPRTGRLIADGAGRVREEFIVRKPDGRELRIAFVTNRTTGRVAVLDLDSGQVLTVSELPGEAVGARPTAPPAAVLTPSGADLMTTDLGIRTIEALTCVGHRIDLTDGRVAEVWRSPDLAGQRILHTVSRGADLEYRLELADIRPGAPDPRLFDVVR